MSKACILLVEDEPGLVLTVSDLLASEGYAVLHAGDYASAQRAVLELDFSLVLLDLMLPGGSGLDILRDLRARGDARPILVLTARATVPERVVGLKLGADDYLPKPFDSMELLARIEALLRRSSSPGAHAHGRGAAGPSALKRFGDIEIDEERAEVRKGGLPLALTVQEHRLLSFLAEHPGKTLSRERLLDQVWGYGADVASRTVDVHVSSLRQKLGDDPAKPRWIITVRGFGYRFEPEGR
ncbi:MAG TPA: DNA-binding response regulator [Spirochaetaceae bacterium]|jgi:DNA-binding response OmpR family regulator|nr:DNA-binding response regulator [Spirochaetaceae bacterium]